MVYRRHPARTFKYGDGSSPDRVAVGHRALVALERTDGRYDLYHSQWGAADWKLAPATWWHGSAGSAADGPSARALAESDPRATDCPFDEIVAEHLDFQQYEVLFGVGRSRTVRPYLVCWFGFPTTVRRDPTHGALVAIDPASPETDGEYHRGLFEGTKAIVATLVERETVTPAQGQALLRDRVEAWSGGWRDVHFGPGPTDETD